MPDIYSKIAAKHDPDARAWLVSDALATARRGLPLNALTTADIDAFQAIMAAEGSWPFLIEAAARTAEVRLTASVVVAGIGQCLEAWTEGGREALTAWEELPELGLPDYDAAILIAAHGLVRSVALFEPEGEGAAAARAALALAAAFAAADRADDAVAAAFTAGNLATLAMSAGEELRASEVLLRHAITADHHEAASVALSRRAYALSRMDKSAQLLAFDAVAAALRHLPNDEQNRRSVATELGLAVDGAEHLAKYKLFLWTAFADVADGEARDLQEQARMAITPVWHLGLTELARQASMITRGAIELERARERLLGDAPADATFASWNTLSFEHPAYRDAIPHGHSVQQERDFDLILLTVGHEMTHVLSMLSGVGIAVVALRAAAAELEATLGTSASRAPGRPAEFLAPLDTTDVFALAQAEQAMDIARKRQILQATWLPWFEGIAVFGELAADPTAEEDTSSDVGQVLVNFVDDVPPDDDLDAIIEWAMARRLAEETRYAGAQRTQGRFRLRRYLDGSRAKYLADYLAVRAIVSRWRAQLRRPLLGAEAYRLLIHRTRFDTWAAVPNLSLPTGQFAVEAEQLMLGWVAGLARTARDDIERFLPSRGPAFWRDGTLVQDPTSVDEWKMEFNDLYHEAVRSALMTNADESEDVLNRVVDADDTTELVMGDIAAALANHSPKPCFADNSAPKSYGRPRSCPSAA